MGTTTAAPGSNRILVIVLWVIKVLLALAFLMASFMKLSSNPQLVAEFNMLPHGTALRYFTGVLELASAIMIVIPRTAVFGALGMCVVCAGAFVARIEVLHGDQIHVVVMFALAAFVAWFSRPAK